MSIKLDSVTIEGFRGVLRPLTLSFGSGFTVISGRNGSGKSTIIDAVEFGMTGQFSAHATEKESGESIQDYIWWRGDDVAEKNEVRVRFVSRNEPAHEITRTRENMGDEALAEFLIEKSQAPSEPLETFLLTTIIRDETIARLSMDLNEAQRYEFIERAIGLTEALNLESRVQVLLKECKAITEPLATEYSNLRSQATLLQSQLSAAKTAAERASKLTFVDVKERMRQFIPQPAETVEDVIAQGFEVLTAMRRRVDELEKLRAATAELKHLAKAFEDTGGSRAVAEIKAELESKQSEAMELATQISVSRAQAASAEKEHPRESAFAQLAHAGEVLGLQNGRCPLCDSKVTPSQLSTHIHDIEFANAERSANYKKLTGAIATLEERNKVVEGRIRELETEIATRLQSQQRITELQSNLQGQKETWLGKAPESTIVDVIVAEGQKIRVLDNLLTDIRAMNLIDNVVQFERDLKVIQQQTDAINVQLANAKEASRLIKEIYDASRLASAEILEDRIASMLPLLRELYDRLRPHTKWVDLEYRTRGQLKRFLSFVVGNDVNPRFVYSSGQRRALGLSFLLGVHLGRKWCKLETLILDDPVQHIDDYRALHIVEVLAAVRKTGRQLVCTVEDPAIADLLCRRLLGPHDIGRRVELEFSPQCGVIIATEEIVGSLPSRALLTA